LSFRANKAEADEVVFGFLCRAKVNLPPLVENGDLVEELG
jgi:hypothetical protein